MANANHPLQHSESRRWVAAGKGGSPICKVELPELVFEATKASKEDLPNEDLPEVHQLKVQQPEVLDAQETLSLREVQLAGVVDDEEMVDDPDTADTADTEASAAPLFRPEARKTWGLGG